MKGPGFVILFEMFHRSGRDQILPPMNRGQLHSQLHDGEGQRGRLLADLQAVLETKLRETKQFKVRCGTFVPFLLHPSPGAVIETPVPKPIWRGGLDLIIL